MVKRGKQSVSYLYLIGMALTVIGFCCPMFKGKLFGSTSNGFSFLSDNGGLMTTAGLLIFIGACAGLLLAVLPFLKISVPCRNLLMCIALAVSIIGGIILVITFSGNGSGNGLTKAINKAAGKGFLKHAYVGFYMILAGWVVALAGWITGK